MVGMTTTESAGLVDMPVLLIDATVSVANQSMSLPSNS